MRYVWQLVSIDICHNNNNLLCLLKECWYGQNSFCIDCSSVCNLKGMKSLVNGGIATLLSNVIKRKLGQIILDFRI